MGRAMGPPAAAAALRAKLRHRRRRPTAAANVMVRSHPMQRPAFGLAGATQSGQSGGVSVGARERETLRESAKNHQNEDGLLVREARTYRT